MSPTPNDAGVNYQAGNPRPLSMSVLATQPYLVDVTTNLPDGNNIDPTELTVAFAFLPEGEEPVSGTVWTSGVWQTTGAGYTASITLGPSGHAVAIGEYVAWMRITGDPQVPVLPVGALTVY